MPTTLGTGSLLSPWIGVWDLVWQSPEAWLVVASAIIGLTLGGAALTYVGKGQQAGAPAVVVVRSESQARPARRSRRRRAA